MVTIRHHEKVAGIGWGQGVIRFDRDGYADVDEETARAITSGTGFHRCITIENRPAPAPAPQRSTPPPPAAKPLRAATEDE